jgi:hypothetical protein
MAIFWKKTSEEIDNLLLFLMQCKNLASKIEKTVMLSIIYAKLQNNSIPIETLHLFTILDKKSLFWE